ncbi:hypothetical protein A2797_01145 [candidate division WWE3 bacterium RIFCSPHIGHO2_01_FULL_48_15]|uniref:Uncharacterized protein n=1 Tax=candidate division WWE3 bacterium RIFCSPHIGHO2_01_FULL_48_15 TaxID=1802619 RepID=A0A1F4VES2_UNCKA|nr:MAG: hypothetical protein A2797_01145 [candidate division WWE3 bacterium RIFCSPHIGHO2_01_FULL_48_15]
MDWLFQPHVLSYLFWGTLTLGIIVILVRAARSRAWNTIIGDFFSAFSLATGAWAVAAVMLAFVAIPFTPTHDSREYRDQQLISMRSADSTSLSFFLFLGTGGGKSEYEPVYVYYVEDNGAIVQRHLTGNIRIYEEDRSDAVLRTWWNRHDTDASGWWQQHVFWVIDTTLWTQGSQEFHVPRGTVRREFVVR